MSNQPNDPTPDDQPPRADIPPEPADLLDLDSDTQPLSDAVGDAEEITEADLFDFSDEETDPMPPTPAAAAAVPTADDDNDALAWDVLEDGSSTSFVGKKQDEPDSSILSGRGTVAGGAGSGWLDSAVNLDLAPDGADDPLGIPTADSSASSSSGVNLHDPDGIGPAESESSIFGKEATDESSRIDLESVTDDVEAVRPASIWDESEAADGDPVTARREEPEQAIDWDAFKELGSQVRNLGHEGGSEDDPQHTLRAPRPDLGDEPADEAADWDAMIGDEPADEAADWDAMKGLGAQVRQLRHDDAADIPTADAVDIPTADAVDDDLSAWLEEEASSAQQPAPRPVQDPTAVGLPVGAAVPARPRKVAPAPVLDSDYDLEVGGDEPVMASPKRARSGDDKKKGKSGAMGWIGGGLLGLLVGGGGVFALSQLGVLPGGDAAKPIVSNPQPGDAAKLTALQAAVTQADADRAEAVKNLDDAEARAKAGAQAVADLAAAKASAKAAADGLAVAKADADEARTALITATQKQIEAQSKLTTAMKDGDNMRVDLNEARDGLKTATRELTVARNRAKASDDLLAGLVKEFQAAKLIDPDADAATALAKLPAAAKDAATAAASGDATKIAEALAAAKKELSVSQAFLKAATDDLTKAKADADTARTVAEDRAKALTAAQAKAKANTDALAALVKEFQAAKLIDPDADAATALAQLPDAAKSAAVAATSGDAKKAAEALLAAKKEADTARLALRKAETEVTLAKQAATLAMVVAEKAAVVAKADAAKAIADAKIDAAKAVAAAIIASDKRAKEAVAKATADTVADAAALVKAAEAKAAAEARVAAKATAEAKAAADALAMKEAEFARQLAAARAISSVGGPILAPGTVAEEKAAAAYSSGVADYFAGRYAEAEKTLRTATAEVADARYSYYLGLALLAQGRTDAAAESFTVGAALERRNRPNARDVGDALLRIQGPARQELAKYRPK